MGFNFFNKKHIWLGLIGGLIFSFSSCSNNQKENTGNTFYVEIVNFNDSLGKYISNHIFGKVSYYKKDKLEVIPVGYVTDEFPDMHYFKSTTELKNTIQEGSRKIKIEFQGKYSFDSIEYSLQKYKFSNKQWTKISDMGVLKETTTFKNAKEYAIPEYGKQIVNNIIVYSYN